MYEEQTLINYKLSGKILSEYLKCAVIFFAHIIAIYTKTDSAGFY